MIFNGHNQESINAIDEVTMNEITVMYADGALGNYGVLQSLGSLTAGVFNYLRSANSQPYELKDILGSSYGYMFTEKESNPSESLMAFITQAHGFNMKQFDKE